MKIVERLALRPTDLQELRTIASELGDHGEGPEIAAGAVRILRGPGCTYIVNIRQADPPGAPAEGSQEPTRQAEMRSALNAIRGPESFEPPSPYYGPEYDSDGKSGHHPIAQAHQALVGKNHEVRCGNETCLVRIDRVEPLSRPVPLNPSLQESLVRAFGIAMSPQLRSFDAVLHYYPDTGRLEFADQPQLRK